MIESTRQPDLDLSTSKGKRLAYCGLGLVSTGVGILGAFLPVLPTTCFMLLALWAFSRSSPRLHRWLWEHKRLGATLRRWQEHRCIPTEAKVAAVVSMVGSMLFVLLFSGLGFLGLLATGAFIAVGAFIVLRAPSRPPGTSTRGRRRRQDSSAPPIRVS